MIIQSSAVQMHSARKYTRFSQTFVGASAQSIGITPGGSLSFSGSKEDTKGGANTSLKSQLFNPGQMKSANVGKLKTSEALKSFAQIQEETISYLMRLFFGKSSIFASSGSMGTSMASGIGFRSETVDITTAQTEVEQTSFSTSGTVITADGRELSFQVDVAMSRSFTQYTSKRMEVLTTTQFCDPLVINLNANAAEITDQKFFFDLDMDGHAEAISQLAQGSGFLALDLNQDGKINDGNELFGARSGNGFADLAKYDSDGNGWIDEADEVFDKLLIWSKDAYGKDVLCGLGQAGIGAIYLGNASTEFSLNSLMDNTTNARVRKTGIFLYENGMAGTIQHVDFAK